MSLSKDTSSGKNDVKNSDRRLSEYNVKLHYKNIMCITDCIVRI